MATVRPGLEPLGRYARSAFYRFQDWFVRPVLGGFARRIYGNGAGLVNNIRAELLLRRARKGTPPSTAVRGDDPRVEFMRREGYLKFTPGYDPELLGIVASKFRRAVEDPAASYSGKYHIAILEPMKRIPELRSLLTDEVQGLLCAHLGSNIRVKQVNCWRILPAPDYDGKKEVYSNFWHCDEFPPVVGGSS